MDIFSILSLIGGLALFLFGMDLMGDGLKKLAGGKLESILARLTANRFLGFLLGFIVTAIIQSSSATTVMLVGFVNSGIMKLGQTINIIMGANIGTTVTAWLLSLTGIDGSTTFLKLLKPESFTPILAVIGVIMTMMAKTDKKKDIGTILIGFAVLMFGMETMSDSVSGLKDNEAFTNILTMFSNPIMGILVGTVFTAIIQSSSASIGILQALSLSCVIPYSTAIPVLLGMNIGTTITPIISSISGNTESRRVAVSCLYIKMIGVVVVTAAFYLLHYIIGFDEFMNAQSTVFYIAVIHTLFNILSTVILMPFCSAIEKLAIKSVKGSKDAKETDIFDTLDERFLSIPAFAVEKCRDLVCEMAKLSQDSFILATGLFNGYSTEKYNKIVEMETLVDKYEDKTSTYLVKIASNSMSVKDSKAVTELLHCIGDIERISDHAVNIAKVAKEMFDKEVSFSEQAQKDIKVITNASLEVLDMAVSALVNEDLAVARNVEPLEQVVDRLKRKIKSNHISRLRQGDCTMELGFILSDLLTNYERVADHCSNIAVCLIEIAHDSFETHEYLSSVKNHNDQSFDEQYAFYKEKYSI
ncbi:MAG: Na/Pi cotransporter family protein [Ruminococcaceae bacterium]|nr:Na/Pi cotransporter family protein [Oscillospiraceae bacterium]